MTQPDLRTWMVRHALPLWAGPGFNQTDGCFEERLALSGELLSDVPRRLMVQARQIHSYALAHRRGWHPRASQLVERAFHSMVRNYHKSDGEDGWIFSVDRNGAPCDRKRDLYAHAFVLLAIGSYVAALGDRRPLVLADETLTYLDRHLAAAGGGYLDSMPALNTMRRQNPHMHLFEALLNLWMHTRERKYLERASAMFELFSRRFFQYDTGVLLEHFDAMLAPAAPKIVEPGHHCEWIWLLRWYERESGVPVKSYVDLLLLYVERFGFDAAGLLVDELSPRGSRRTLSRRLWPMTEAIKAYLIEDRKERASELGTLLHQYFLSGVVDGGWMDRLDEQGNPAIDFMPASSLYHVVGAVDALWEYGVPVTG